MARITSIIKFEGSIGNELTGSSYKGIPVLSKKILKSAQPNTEEQRSQRTKFKLVNEMLAEAAGFTRYSFCEKGGKRFSHQTAVAYNMKQAVGGTFPDYVIDYDKFMLGKGSQEQVTALTVTRQTDRVEVRWTNDDMGTRASITDVVMVALYNQSRNDWYYKTSGTTRADNQMVVYPPQKWASDEIHCWVVTRDKLAKRVSDSDHFVLSIA